MDPSVPVPTAVLTTAPTSVPTTSVPTPTAPVVKKKRVRQVDLLDTQDLDEQLERMAEELDEPEPELLKFVVNDGDYDSDHPASDHEEDDDKEDDLSGMTIDLSNLPAKRTRKPTQHYVHPFQAEMDAKYEKQRLKRLQSHPVQNTENADKNVAAEEEDVGEDCDEEENEGEHGEHEDGGGEDGENGEDEDEEVAGEEDEDAVEEDDDPDYEPTDEEEVEGVEEEGEDVEDAEDEEEVVPAKKTGRKRRLDD